jgi:PhzF family phenazine biosynthesis protein
MKITACHCDAFSPTPQLGNPAGVVLTADDLTDAQMQQIAQKLGFSETAFVLRSKSADLRLRYFTPGHEVDLCGHATVGALYALYLREMLGEGSFTVETKAGLLEMSVTDTGYSVQIGMAQNPAQFVPYEGDPAAVAEVLGLTAADLAPELPIVYGSTGLWTLLVPVTGLDAMRRIVPDTARFPEVLTQMPRVSIHPFCLETIDPYAQMHGRHFSSPYSGTVEDPVTGTASGVMGAYHAKYIDQRDGQFIFIVEQGQEIRRDGRVRVEVDVEGDAYRVRITGTACFVRDVTVEI